MMRSGILVLMAMLTLTACTSVPLENINRTPIVSSNSNLTPEQISSAIVRAGVALGWKMEADRPGHVLATLHLRGHVAIVDVNYDAKFYSITYKDSSNLEYDGKNIHRNYNGWIENLNKRIQMELSLYK